MTKYRPGEVHRCPQCAGKGEFMKTECFTCDGKGKVDPDAV